jgi:phospholipid/cholesterol/gamma-HCH transport system substrate-binding protein
MLSRTVRLQLTAFVVIALVGLSYISVRYVGLLRWIGSSGYTVHVDLAGGGGIFTNAEVDYRGVPVGRVGDMRLTATGIQVDLRITSSRPIPDDLKAVVADRSVIGEQYLDLQPQRSAGPYLRDGSKIAQADTTLPPSVESVLVNTDQLVASVPIASLQTVVNELYDATQDVGQQLRTLTTSTQGFFTAATQNLPQTLDLIAAGQTVLGTQQQEAAAITTFSDNLAQIGRQLVDSNGDITKVLSTAAPALDQVRGLTTQLQGSLGGLLSNLLTTSAVFLQQGNGLRQVLINLPVAVSIGGSVITPQGVNIGLVPTFFDPLPCTAGYQGTQLRTGLDTAGNPALNTGASCTAPASSGVDVRGSQNAPR